VLAIPGVADVALIVHDAVGKEPRVAMAVVAEAVTREAIAAVIRAQFDAVFVPKILKFVPQIPRTERGKRSAEALRELLGLTAAPTTNLVEVRRVAPGAYLAYIPRELVFFGGHFEALAILPGAVLVERVVWPAVRAEYPEVRAMRGIRRLRFRRPVFPDHTLSIALKRAGGAVTFEVACAAAPVASGQLLVE
jgi:hypothetical protein